MLSKLALKRYDKESGFTLIELLVVILIIGILAAIAVPAFMNQRKEATNAQLKSDMRAVATWMETYKIKNPNAQYPRIAKDWRSGTSVTTWSNWPAEVVLSEGTGIITSDSGSSQAYFGGHPAPAGAGFCIEGQALGSGYDLTGSGGSRMYYNSLKGGFTNNCTLPAGNY